MITKTEGYKDGHREIYHRAGTIDGRRDEKFAWTHPESEKDTCVACTKNQIPPDVKKSPR